MKIRTLQSYRRRLCVLVILCLSLSGCAILRLPFDLLGGIWQIVRKIPMPPPWVFF